MQIFPGWVGAAMWLRNIESRDGLMITFDYRLGGWGRNKPKSWLRNIWMVPKLVIIFVLFLPLIPLFYNFSLLFLSSRANLGILTLFAAQVGSKTYICTYRIKGSNKNIIWALAIIHYLFYKKGFWKLGQNSPSYSMLQG